MRQLPRRPSDGSETRAMGAHGLPKRPLAEVLRARGVGWRRANLYHYVSTIIVLLSQNKTPIYIFDPEFYAFEIKLSFVNKISKVKHKIKRR